MTLEQAISVAMEAHDGQVDKRGEPYILHPLRVMLSVSARDRVVAVLHDVIEDTDYDYALLEPPRLTDDEWMALWLLTRRDDETYADYILRIRDADGEAGKIARTVKRVDLDDNVRRIPVTNHELSGLRERYTRAEEVLSHA